MQTNEASKPETKMRLIGPKPEGAVRIIKLFLSYLFVLGIIILTSYATVYQWFYLEDKKEEFFSNS